jgi:hypothetical protein
MASIAHIRLNSDFFYWIFFVKFYKTVLVTASHVLPLQTGIGDSQPCPSVTNRYW